MKTSDYFPLPIAAPALQIGRRGMWAFAHVKSPRTFTQPQLPACLVVRPI